MKFFHLAENNFMQHYSLGSSWLENTFAENDLSM